jgi:monovalent cation:H+ antiporter-2, CPA2 family
MGGGSFIADVSQAAASATVAKTVAEIGLVLIGLGLLARLASVMGLSSVPFFLLVGLALGDGGLLPLDLSEPFIELSAETGAILLLFFLGLEFSAQTIASELRHHRRMGLFDILFNAAPGAIAGLLLGWGWFGAFALAGVTYISSSGIATQVTREMGWRSRPEWKRLVSVLVLEDLVMAPYLPVLVAIAGAASLIGGLITVSLGLAVVAFIMFIGIRGVAVSRRLLDPTHGSAFLLIVLGLAMAAGGLAAGVGFSSAVAAFLFGLLITGDVAQAARERLAPLRDLFASLFFLFFGLQTDPSSVPAALPVAILLAVITIGSKVATVYTSVRRDEHLEHPWYVALRGGGVLGARGEFSVAIGTIVAASQLAPDGWAAMVATYVVATAVLGPLLARWADRSYLRQRGFDT